MDSGFICSQDSPSDINFLKQNFSQLPVDGQSCLKDYLQSLVSLQNAITGVNSVDKIPISSKEA
jgi:hypothetical protein